MEEWLGTKYPCVKDIVIPYQRVTTAHFESTPEHMAKWMNEINRNPDGSLRPAEEVNELTQKLLGHFHSHDSVGGGKASWTDSEDVREHREGAPYWIELIGSRKGFHGRIAITEPTPLISEARVIIKWWTGVEETLGLMSGKVFKEKRTYEYYTPKPIYTKPVQSHLGYDPKVDTTGFVRDDDGKIINTKSGLVAGRSIAEGIMGDGCKIFPWDKDDPVQVEEGILDKDIIDAIVELFEGTLLGDEEILVELWDDGTIEWTVYEEGRFAGMMLDLMDDRYPDQYEEYIRLVTDLGISEMFTTMKSREGYSSIPRTVSWDNVPPDTIFLSEYVSLFRDDYEHEREPLPKGFKIVAVDGIPIGEQLDQLEIDEIIYEGIEGLFEQETKGKETPTLRELTLGGFMR